MPPATFLRSLQRRFRIRSSRKLVGVAFWLTFMFCAGYFVISTLVSTEIEITKAKTPRRKSPATGTQAVFRRPPLPKKRPPKLASHTFRDDGLLELNLEGRHPIFDLISRAEKEWEHRMATASRSLDEAVAEYKRRYKRPPPKGFDRWWDYVEEHNVLLPDEYDQIERDLGLFWAVSPSELRRLQFEHEDHQESWTMGKVDGGRLTLVNSSLPDNMRAVHEGAAQAALDLLRPIEHLLPPFRAVFSPNDVGNQVRSYEVEQWMRDAISEKKYIDVHSLPPHEFKGWRSGCAPTSKARQIHYDLEAPLATPSSKTFIWDHRGATDMCQHPSLLYNHGEFLAFPYGPLSYLPMVPQFSSSTTSAQFDLRWPNPWGWLDDLSRDDDPEWELRPDDRLLWRGRNTGMWQSDDMHWHNHQRLRLVKQAHHDSGAARVLVGARPEERVHEKAFERGPLNHAAFDVEFADGPISCDDKTCALLREMFDFVPPMNQHEQGQYKYFMDIDGNGWSSRFKRLITTHALVFKATLYNEWFADRIMPWVHYVPIQMDLSDLYDALVFFRGDTNGVGAHDDLAKKIAYEGRKWSRTMWREEDMTAYMFRLFLEYGRLMSDNRDTMNYQDTQEW